MLADNNYNASALFWYTQRYHAEPRTEVRVPLASGARSDWGLLGVFRSFDRANRPWGSPRLSGRASWTTGLVHGRVNSVGGSFCFGKADYANLCGEVRKSAIDYAILTFGTK